MIPATYSNGNGCPNSEPSVAYPCYPICLCTAFTALFINLPTEYISRCLTHAIVYLLLPQQNPDLLADHHALRACAS